MKDWMHGKRLIFSRLCWVDGWVDCVCCSCWQTISLFGTGIALLCLCTTSHYGAGLFCMAVAVACCGIHNSGILINPQDIAPKYAGSVFGMSCFLSLVHVFTGRCKIYALLLFMVTLKMSINIADFMMQDH